MESGESRQASMRWRIQKDKDAVQVSADYQNVLKGKKKKEKNPVNLGRENIPIRTVGPFEHFGGSPRLKTTSPNKNN